MLAAEQDPAEQELPKSICQPRHVRLFVLALNAGSLQRVENGQDRFPVARDRPSAACGQPVVVPSPSASRALLLDESFLRGTWIATIRR